MPPLSQIPFPYALLQFAGGCRFASNFRKKPGKKKHKAEQKTDISSVLYHILHRTAQTNRFVLSDTQMLADRNETSHETDAHTNDYYDRGQCCKNCIYRQEMQQIRQYGKFGPYIIHNLIV